MTIEMTSGGLPVNQAVSQDLAVSHIMRSDFLVSCQVPARTVNAWTFSTMRLMLFRDGRVNGRTPRPIRLCAML